MMQVMRKQAKGFLAFILFGLLILSFGIWGIGDIFRPVTGRTVVIEIGGAEVPAERLANDVQRELAELRTRSGVSLDLEQALQLGLVNQVVGRLVGATLLDLESRDLGVVVSDRVVSDAVQTDTAFRNQFGKFDRVRYRSVLASQGLSERGFEEILRGDLRRRQLASGVTANDTVPKSLAHAIYRYRREQRVAEILFIPDDSIRDIPAPTESDLESYHKDNAAAFTAPEYRKVVAVIIRSDMLAADIEVGAERLEDEYRARLDEFETPEKRTVEQLLFSDQGRAEEAATRVAAGEDYAAVGKDILDQEPLSLGALARHDLPIEAMSKAVFALGSGAVSAPVQTPLGWHLLRVTKIEAGSVTSFEEAREKLLAEIKNELAIDAAIELGEDLDKEIGSGTNLKAAAEKFGLPLTTFEAIDARGRGRDGKVVDGIPEDSDFVSQAFELAAGEEGLLSDAGDGSLFILQVDSVTSADVRPLAEIRAKVAAAWTADRRSEAAAKSAQAIAAKAGDGGASLADLAAGIGRDSRTTDPFMRSGTGAGERVSTALVEKLFAARSGEAVWAATQQGHVVGVLKQVRQANPLGDSEGVKQVTAGLSRAVTNDLLDQFAGALRDRYPVEIDQAAIADMFTRQ